MSNTTSHDPQKTHADGSAMLLYKRLKADLLSAMKARQSIAVATLRSMVGAIDNAGAVEHDTTIVPLVGRSADVPRRELTEAQVRAILQGEADERRSAQVKYERLGKNMEAERLRAELEVFARYLGDAAPDSQE